MEHSTPPTLSTASSNTAAMTTLWQRGLQSQWCRKSKPKLEALRGAGVWRELVVRVDSPKLAPHKSYLANTLHAPLN